VLACLYARELRCDSQVLEVSARELGVCDNLDLSITNLLDLNDVSEVSDTAINLDLVLEELLECSNVEDLVAGGLRSVDDELLGISKTTLRNINKEVNGLLTFLVTLGPLALDFYTNDLSLLYHAATLKRRRANSKAISSTYCGWCHCDG